MTALAWQSPIIQSCFRDLGIPLESVPRERKWKPIISQGPRLETGIAFSSVPILLVRQFAKSSLDSRGRRIRLDLLMKILLNEVIWTLLGP